MVQKKEYFESTNMYIIFLFFNFWSLWLFEVTSINEVISLLLMLFLFFFNKYKNLKQLTKNKKQTNLLLLNQHLLDLKYSINSEKEKKKTKFY